MVGTVTGRAVTMPPAVVVRKEPLEAPEEVRLGPCAELHDHDSRRGMRHEDVQQPVAGARYEALAFIRQVRQRWTAARPNRQLDRSHRTKIDTLRP
jgi:hypothetical protein